MPVCLLNYQDGFLKGSFLVIAVESNGSNCFYCKKVMKCYFHSNENNQCLSKAYVF